MSEFRPRQLRFSSFRAGFKLKVPSGDLLTRNRCLKGIYIYIYIYIYLILVPYLGSPQITREEPRKSLIRVPPLVPWLLRRRTALHGILALGWGGTLGRAPERLRPKLTLSPLSSASAKCLRFHVLTFLFFQYGFRACRGSPKPKQSEPPSKSCETCGFALHPAT